MIRSLYQTVMDERRNPLQSLPMMVRFQFMVVLSYMWSVVFSLYVGMIALVGPSILAHTIILVGVFFTADIFRRARHHALSHDDPLGSPVKTNDGHGRATSPQPALVRT